MSHRIILGDEDFEQLIRGQIVKIDEVEIALADIGFREMNRIISAAIQIEGVKCDDSISNR